MRGLAAVLLLAAPLCALAQTAHCQHVHRNSTDPAAAIGFDTSEFKAGKESFAGLADAVWTGEGPDQVAIELTQDTTPKPAAVSDD